MVQLLRAIMQIVNNFANLHKQKRNALLTPPTMALYKFE